MTYQTNFLSGETIQVRVHPMAASADDVRFEYGYESGKWYHQVLVCTGEKPDLFVDGRKVEGEV